jgi:hypothetical protein
MKNSFKWLVIFGSGPLLLLLCCGGLSVLRSGIEALSSFALRPGTALFDGTIDKKATRVLGSAFDHSIRDAAEGRRLLLPDLRRPVRPHGGVAFAYLG